jgi:hypothetical protein
MATTTSSYRKEKLGDPWACQSQCQSQQGCNFVQWNDSSKMCQFFYGDIEEIYKDKESLLGAGDCKNITSALWKKKPIITTTTTTTTTTTPTTITRTILSPSAATAVSEAGGTANPQNQTMSRYVYYYRESK